MKYILIIGAVLVGSILGANVPMDPEPIAQVLSPESDSIDSADGVGPRSMKHVLERHLEAIQANARELQQHRGSVKGIHSSKLEKDLQLLQQLHVEKPAAGNGLEEEPIQIPPRVLQAVEDNNEEKKEFDIAVQENPETAEETPMPEDSMRESMRTLQHIRTSVISPIRLITLAVQSLLNTLRDSGGLFYRIRDDILRDVQNEINQQKVLEMQIKLDGYRSTLRHLQTLLGISDHWTLAEINECLDGNCDTSLEQELDAVQLTPLFMMDLNTFFHTVNSDKHIFVLRAPGEVITALSHYSEYAITNLYLTQTMIDLSIHIDDPPATESYRRQYLENADYHYRYMQFCIAKTVYFMDKTQGSYTKHYLRRQAYYTDELHELTVFFPISELHAAAVGEPSVDESLYIRQADVVAFMRVYDTSRFDQWLSCYNGGKNCGTATCPGEDQPFEDLEQLPCVGEIFQIFAEKDGVISNSDVVAVNYNNGVTKGNRWWWLAIPNTSPDTRDCPGSQFAQGVPFDPTCEFERLRVWTPTKMAGEPLKDRDLVFFERQTDSSRYLEVGSAPSMYRIYRYGSIYKGVSYWTE